MITEEKEIYRKELLKNCYIVKINRQAMEILLDIEKKHSCFVRADEPMSGFVGVYNIGSDHYYVCEYEKLGITIE